MNRKRALRIAPSHYHVGHIVPATVAKEMLFFEDEGLEEYEIVGGGIIPAVAEAIGLTRAMKEKSIDIVPDAKPLSVFSLRDKKEEIHILNLDAVQRAFQQLQQREELTEEFSRAKEVFAIRDAQEA